MKKDFMIFGSPHIEQAEIDEVVDCLKSGWLSTGPRVEQFEKAFSEYVGIKHALAVNSCTAGLHLGLLAADIGPGDEVITTPLTFAATANVIVHVGARPVFVDISEEDMNIDPAKIEAAITPNTKAIIPVHFAGNPCDMDAILEIAAKHDLYVFSDAAHAVEAKYHGKHVGAIRHLAVFSFYVTKNLVTGEGGMITTNNDFWAEKIKILALHGLSHGAWNRYSDEGFKHYQVILPGFKYNMMDIQASLGLHQLDRIETSLKHRESVWARYDQAFAELPCVTPPKPGPDVKHARHLYTLLIDEKTAGVSRNKFQAQLYDQGIGTGIHFMALHLHPYYKNKFDYTRDQFPNSEFVSDRTISLPLSSKLTDDEVARVIETVRNTLRHSLPTIGLPRAFEAI
ncbi:MAG TPA: DegT/DnrJ/EryC1/StrS family aminotransferase [Actinobacteria bacterium]|nr:DegT/DnrJ/EryC1/StrS family aminotransferase [Actinomycetota bacterium]